MVVQDFINVKAEILGVPADASPTDVRLAFRSGDDHAFFSFLSSYLFFDLSDSGNDEERKTKISSIVSLLTTKLGSIFDIVGLGIEVYLQYPMSNVYSVPNYINTHVARLKNFGSVVNTNINVSYQLDDLFLSVAINPYQRTSNGNNLDGGVQLHLELKNIDISSEDVDNFSSSSPTILNEEEISRIISKFFRILSESDDFIVGEN